MTKKLPALPLSKEDKLKLYDDKTSLLAKGRMMVNLPIVRDSLDEVEKLVFDASTKRTVNEININELMVSLAEMLQYICRDVGIRISDDTNDWAYMCARILDIMKTHHYNRTLDEVKLAFELSAVGKLNEFLPKDRNGNPDKNHYQMMNVEYFSKIMNAYDAYKNQVIWKAHEALPRLPAKVKPELQKKSHDFVVGEMIKMFDKYQEDGIVDNSQYMIIRFVYGTLKKHGYSTGHKVTEEDKKASYREYKARFVSGMINKYAMAKVNKDKHNSKEIIPGAIEAAVVREIKAGFDKMIKENVHIKDLIT